MEEKKQITINVSFSDVKLLAFQVTNYGNDLKDPLPSDKYEFSFDINSRVKIDEKTFETILTARLFDKLNPPNQELASMRAKFELTLVNFNEIATIVKDTVKVPDNLVKLAISSAVATARGMFAMCVSVHKFSNAIIPLINVEDFKMQNTPQPI